MQGKLMRPDMVALTKHKVCYTFFLQYLHIHLENIRATMAHSLSNRKNMTQISPYTASTNQKLQLYEQSSLLTHSGEYNDSEQFVLHRPHNIPPLEHKYKQNRVYKRKQYYNLHLQAHSKKTSTHILVVILSLFSHFYFNGK